MDNKFKYHHFVTRGNDGLFYVYVPEINNVTFGYTKSDAAYMGWDMVGTYLLDEAEFPALLKTKEACDKAKEFEMPEEGILFKDAPSTREIDVDGYREMIGKKFSGQRLFLRWRHFCAKVKYTLGGGKNKK